MIANLLPESSFRPSTHQRHETLPRVIARMQTRAEQHPKLQPTVFLPRAAMVGERETRDG